MDSNTKRTYEQLNFLSLVAMFMIVNIHYFSNFAKYVEPGIILDLVHLLQAASIVAVPVYLIISGFTNIYLERDVNLKKIFLYIVVPTILFQQLNHIMFDWQPGGWTFGQGFINSWFGDLYLGLMIVLPISLTFKKANPKLSWIVFAILTVIGYGLSIKTHSPNLNLFGIWVFIPYIGSIFVTTYLAFNTRELNRGAMIAAIVGLILIISVFFMNPVKESGITLQIVRSYFSPFVLAYAILLVKLFMTFDFNLSWVRRISRSSYFFYFSHYIGIHILLEWYPDFPKNHVFIAYFAVVVIAYTLGFLLFEGYDFCIRLLKL